MRARLPAPRTVARGLLVLLLIWPPVHMLLAPRLNFSSWRYGGWGMYATPDPRHAVELLVISRHEGLPGACLRPVCTMRLEGDELVAIDHALPLPFAVWEPSLRRAQALADREALRFLTELAHHGPELDSAVVARVERRLAPLRGVAFVSLDVYLYRRGRITPFARQDSDQASARALLVRAGRAAGL